MAQAIHETVTVREAVLAQANGKEISFTNGWASQFHTPTWANPYRLEYGKSTYHIDSIRFYEVGGNDVKFQTKGWFTTTGLSNNPYKCMSLLDNNEPAHITRKTGAAEKHFKQDKPFFISRGRDFTNELIADLYIPMDYLDGMGWQVVERVMESGYQTSTYVTVEVAPSHGSSKKPLFEMHYAMKTEKHFDVIKAAMIATLENAETPEDIKHVIEEFRYKF